MTDLNGKTLIVTGASRGIGRAVAERCAQEGAYVGLNFLRSADAATELRNRFPENTELLPFDVADYDDAQRQIRAFAERRQCLDALVNNAGVVRPRLFVSRRALSGIPEELLVNTLGTMICTHAALPFMIKRKAGVIINISSCAVRDPAPGQAIYVASKAAIEGFSRAVATEYSSRGIRSICLRLGPVDTDMLRTAVGDEAMNTSIPAKTLSNRLATPSEVAELICSLLTGMSALATGSVLDFTSGYSRL
jgi:3-oxoacyl-[acyl-carrier protein] reductase